jgi:hypothetical protein
VGRTFGARKLAILPLPMCPSVTGPGFFGRPLTRRALPLLLTAALAAGCAAPRPEPSPAPIAPPEAARAPLDAAREACPSGRCPLELFPGTTVDTLLVDEAARRVEVRFTEPLQHRPFRPADVETLRAALAGALAPFFPGYALDLRVEGRPVEALVPNAFRAPSDRDPAREARPEARPAPLVRNLSRPWAPTAGLQGRYVALWPSHGWYYEPSLDRWEWQRARLFTTIEDLLPMAFTHPYVVPMLERAGATVLLPRERDLQPHEAVVDNDDPASGYAETGPWRTDPRPAFARGTPPYTERVNPFRLGTARLAEASAPGTAEARWTPEIPEAGEYAVHVAYTSAPDRAEDALYTVHHAGGATRFLVNQRIGGGTWVYLGTFRFAAGRDPEGGAVVLSGRSDTPGATVSADAVRFGGGMGDVARNGKTSGRPRWTEAARYYLQYAGMPDSTVYSPSGYQNEYTDDFRGRPEWVNYLRGAPHGPNADRQAPGLGIPVDLSLAFHTDAGVSRSDTTIGTLMIYATEGMDSLQVFPDGVSRLANRDLGDLLQSQIVDDVRALYDPIWRRRPLWDRRYAEAVRPNVPSALLELLSHQNYLDMRFALDPRFRADASRAIYKGILRFLADHHGFDYVVQPLPASHFQAELSGRDGVALRWRPVSDPLEPSAEPEAYVVYTRVGEGGFDDGVLVRGPEASFTGLAPGVVYSYRVAAVNAGGESAPSETLAVAHLPEGGPPVLVVNGFTRVAPPAAVEAGEFVGFFPLADPGVPDRYDLHTTGDQYNFRRGDPWTDDDAPGHGASHADLETRVLAGNTFDYPALHGASILAAGRPFASASADALAAGTVDLAPYGALDLALGAQRRTPWPKPTREPAFEALPPDLRQALAGFCASGRGLLVSGAHVGTDLFEGEDEGAPGPAFARETLGMFWRTDHAARTGALTAPNDGLLPAGTALAFNAGPDERHYFALPDGIEPADESGATVLRYAENNVSAAVARRGACPAVTLGFPFEIVLTQEARDTLMASALRYLTIP